MAKRSLLFGIAVLALGMSLLTTTSPADDMDPGSPGDYFSALFPYVDYGTFYAYYCEDCTNPGYFSYDLIAGTVNNVTYTYPEVIPPCDCATGGCIQVEVDLAARKKDKKEALQNPVGATARPLTTPTVHPVIASNANKIMKIGQWKVAYTPPGDIVPIKMHIYLWRVGRRQHPLPQTHPESRIPHKSFGTGFIVGQFINPKTFVKPGNPNPATASVDETPADFTNADISRVVKVLGKNGQPTGDYDITISALGTFRVLSIRE